MAKQDGENPFIRTYSRPLAHSAESVLSIIELQNVALDILERQKHQTDEVNSSCPTIDDMITELHAYHGRASRLRSEMRELRERATLLRMRATRLESTQRARALKRESERFEQTLAEERLKPQPLLMSLPPEERAKEEAKEKKSGKERRPFSAARSGNKSYFDSTEKRRMLTSTGCNLITKCSKEVKDCYTIDYTIRDLRRKN